VLVVEREVVGDARDLRMEVATAEVLGRHLLAGRGLHQRRPAEEDRAGPLHDHRLVAHRRDVCAAGRRAAHHQRHLRDPKRRHPGLVVEDPPEVVAVGEDVGLQWQERSTRIDEVHARQPVLERDLLRAEVLLDGHWVVGAALDGRVVGDDDTGRALDPADSRDHARTRRIVVVHAVRSERAQLEEGAPGIEQAVDPFADRQLAPLAMSSDRALVTAGATFAESSGPGTEVIDERLH
jgi:hypothetical protein